MAKDTNLSMAESMTAETQKMSDGEFQKRIKVLEEEIRHKDEEIVELQEVVEDAHKIIEALEKPT